MSNIYFCAPSANAGTVTALKCWNISPVCMNEIVYTVKSESVGISYGERGFGLLRAAYRYELPI